MRKLASIQKILEINPIQNADSIEVATVLGWKVVVKKGEFTVGDLCVYFEVDSILPSTEAFHFLEKHKYRLTTMRMRGQISQGLCSQLSILPADVLNNMHEGMDVTEILQVVKYEEVFPTEMIGKSKGFHPTIVRKTGEMRVQSDPRLIEEFQGLEVAFMDKIEGVSSSFIEHNDEIDVCSHYHSLLESDDCVQWQMAYKYNILDILNGYKELSIQGEIAGPGILGNPMGLDEKELFVFRITDLETNERFSPKRLVSFCNEHGLKLVPMKTEIIFDFSMDEIIELAKGDYSPSGTPREGIVVVPMKPNTYSEVLADWLSMKVINNDYLLGEWKRKSKKKQK